MIKQIIAFAVWAVGCCCLFCFPAAADVPSEYSLQFDIERDLSIIAVSTALWVIPAATDRGASLRICDPYCDPSSVNAWDRHVVQHHNEGARVASDVLVGVLPAQALWLAAWDLRRRGGDEAAADVIVLMETLTVAGALSQLVKLAVERPRPYMYRPEVDEGLRQHNADDYRSFYSAHTTVVFSVLTAAAFIYAKRSTSKRFRPLVWLSAMFAGATVAALRVAAGKHFYTDVITGAVLGTAVGIVVPAIHFARRPVHRARRWLPCGLGVSTRF